MTNVYLPGALRPDMAPGKTYDDIQLDWDRHGPCRHIVACAEPWADINAFAIPPSFTPGQCGTQHHQWAWHVLAPVRFIEEHSRYRAHQGNVARRIHGAVQVSVLLRRRRTTVDFRNPQTFGKITAQQGGFSGLGARTMTTAIFRLEF